MRALAAVCCLAPPPQQRAQHLCGPGGRLAAQRGGCGDLAEAPSPHASRRQTVDWPSLPMLCGCPGAAPRRRRPVASHVHEHASSLAPHSPRVHALLLAAQSRRLHCRSLKQQTASPSCLGLDKTTLAIPPRPRSQSAARRFPAQRTGRRLDRPTTAQGQPVGRRARPLRRRVRQTLRCLCASRARAARPEHGCNRRLAHGHGHGPALRYVHGCVHGAGCWASVGRQRRAEHGTPAAPPTESSSEAES